MTAQSRLHRLPEKQKLSRPLTRRRKTRAVCGGGSVTVPEEATASPGGGGDSAQGSHRQPGEAGVGPPTSDSTSSCPAISLATRAVSESPGKTGPERRSSLFGIVRWRRAPVSTCILRRASRLYAAGGPRGFLFSAAPRTFKNVRFHMDLPEHTGRPRLLPISLCLDIPQELVAWIPTPGTWGRKPTCQPRFTQTGPWGPQLCVWTPL